jgi:biopolymer transport protein TolR
LPQAKAAPVDPKEPVIVTVRKDGATYLGAEELPSSGLGQAMRARFGDNPATIIHLRGDREASYGEIVAVMDELARAGFAKIALMTTTQGRPAEQPVLPAPAATP